MLFLQPSVAAISSSDIQSILGGTPYYDPNSISSSYCGSSPGITTGSGSASDGGTAISRSQVEVAKTIMGIAKTNNIGKDAALVGLMAGLDESHLTILANTTVPVSESNPTKQGDGSNFDSVGVFQQRPSQNWSTIASGPEADSNQAAVWQLMDPAYSAEAFFGSPTGSNAPSALSKGLQDKSGWQSWQPWVAVQAVQGSATSDGSNYKAFVGQAQSLINQYWDVASPVPLPVAFSGGSTSGYGSPCFSGSGSCGVNSPVTGSVGGSGGEYSQAQLTAIFGDPGTQDDHASMEAKQVTVNFLGNSVQVNPLVAPCLSAVALEIQQSGSTYQIREMGCYRFDSDNGTSNIGLRSYHTYGAACDINWDTNPFSESGADVPHDMPQEYITAFNDNGFTWGGNWQQPKDFMHFEFNGIVPPQ